MCSLCSAGSYSGSPGSVSCVDCSAGEFSEKNATVCSLCTAGTFTNVTAAAACTNCDAGSSTAGATGSTNCTICAAGTISKAAGTPSCSRCSKGSSTIGQSGADKCTLCDKGHFSDSKGQASCEACSPGSFAGVTGAEICVPCKAGSIAPAPAAEECTACSAGSSAPVNSSVCTLCEAGTFADKQASPACKPCAAGSVAPDQGSASCGLCEAGNFQNETGQAACSACDVGSFAASTGCSSCTECSAGSVAPSEGSVGCGACKAGSFQDETGQAACKACSRGSFQAKAGAATCTSCPNNRTYTTYSTGCTSPADCIGPLLSYSTPEPTHTDSQTIMDATTLKYSGKITFSAVGGDWVIRNPSDPYVEFIQLKQGSKPVSITVKGTVIIEPDMPNVFCYKDSEDHGKMFVGYQNKDATGAACDDGALCRNVDGDKMGPQCLVKGKPSACGIPTCVWDVKCSSGNGVGYRGSANSVKLGKSTIPCQAWNKDYPHVHGFHPNPYNTAKYGIGNNNLCRNPDPRNIQVPWCYSTSHWTRSAPCAVPKCDSTLPYF